MALLAEELVQEWLNRKGYFTIRDLKIGVHEIDLLAIKPTKSVKWECRHVEVQISHKPVSGICTLPKELQKSTGRSANSAKVKTPEELALSVEAWVHKKFHHPRKKAIRDSLCSGPWAMELVVNQVRHEEEIKAIEGHGVGITRFPAILNDLRGGLPMNFHASAGDFAQLIAR